MSRDRAIGQAVEKREHVFVFLDFKRRLDKIVANRQVEPLGEPAIHGFAHVEIVPVRRVDLDLRNAIPRVIKVVNPLDRGVFHRWRVLRPILGGTDQQERLGCKRRADIDIVRIDPQRGRVFANTPPLHEGRDHAHRRGHLQPVVNRVKIIRLRAPAGLARATQAGRIDLGQFAEEVEGADAVPKLQPQNADVPQHALVLLVCPRRAVDDAVSLFLIRPGQMARAVIVIDHIPHKRRASHAGKGNAACGVGCVPVLQAPEFGMPVRTEDAGMAVGLWIHRAKEATAHVKIGQALEMGFF